MVEYTKSDILRTSISQDIFVATALFEGLGILSVWDWMEQRLLLKEKIHVYISNYYHYTEFHN